MKASSSMRRGVQRALFSAAWLCVTGCGATGLDWVGEAQLGSASQQRVNIAQESNLDGATSVIPARAEQSPNDARPRLSHTVTLGEIDAVAVQTEAQGNSAGPSVIVNNYNQVNVTAPAYGYGSYGYYRGPAGFSPGRVTPYPSQPSAQRTLPGQNWPAVADHGPAFPYATLPASPWTRTQ